MGARHARQRARRKSQEMTGTFSNQARACRHCGHLEPGWTMDSPAGTRAMTTLRKLPTTRPKTKAQAPGQRPKNRVTASEPTPERGAEPEVVRTADARDEPALRSWTRLRPQSCVPVSPSKGLW